MLIRLSRYVGAAARGMGLLLGTTLLGGCSNVHTDLYLAPENPGAVGLFESLARPDAVRIARGQLVVEYSPDIDRVVRIGMHRGPNLVHTVGLDGEPDGDGSYTFFGGGYTWVAPQSGELGWRAENGELLSWPPDPAMDTGPARVVGRSVYGLVAENPESRDGIVQRKTFELTSPSELMLRYELRNTSDAVLRRAHWVNTAVAPNAVIALKMEDNGSVAQLYSDTAGGADIIGAYMTDRDQFGWSLIPLADLSFTDGIKIYTDGPAEIAVWVPNPDWLLTRGFWLHRRLVLPMSLEDRNSLRAIGEGPVAVYLHPGLELFEAELYGPVLDIESGGIGVSSEIWTIYTAPTPDTYFMREENRLPRG